MKKIHLFVVSVVLLLAFAGFDSLAQSELPVKVAVYGPEGVGPYSEHQCLAVSGGVECNFQNAPALNVPKRYFGVIFQSGWGHVQGPNGPRAGNFEVVDGQAHGFRAGCPPGCQTVQLHPHTGGGSGSPLTWAAPNSAGIVEVQRVNDHTFFIKLVGSTPPPPPPPSDRDGDGVPDNQDRCPDQFGPLSNNGCPVQPPPPTGGNVATDGGRSISLTTSDRRFTLSECSGITVYAWQGSGEEIILAPLSGCTYGVPSFLSEVWIRITGWWWTSAAGCAFVRQGNAAYLVLTNCFTQVTPPPPPPSKDIICLLAGPDRRFNDVEIIQALDLWIAQGRNPSVVGTIPDGMMVAMISLWVTGEDCGKFSNIRFTSLDVAALTKAQKKEVKALFKKAKQGLDRDAKCGLQRLEVVFGLKRKLSRSCLTLKGVIAMTKQESSVVFRQLSLSEPVFELTGLNLTVNAVKVKIFSLTGGLLYESDWEAAHFGQSQINARIILSNGVYLAVIVSRDALGNQQNHKEVKKIIIIK